MAPITPVGEGNVSPIPPVATNPVAVPIVQVTDGSEQSVAPVVEPEVAPITPVGEDNVSPIPPVATEPVAAPVVQVTDGSEQSVAPVVEPEVAPITPVTEGVVSPTGQGESTSISTTTPPVEPLINPELVSSETRPITNIDTSSEVIPVSTQPDPLSPQSLSSFSDASVDSFPPTPENVKEPVKNIGSEVESNLEYTPDTKPMPLPKDPIKLEVLDRTHNVHHGGEDTTVENPVSTSKPPEIQSTSDEKLEPLPIKWFVFKQPVIIKNSLINYLSKNICSQYYNLNTNIVGDKKTEVCNVRSPQNIKSDTKLYTLG